MNELAGQAADRLERQNVQALALGRLISIASRIEPGLLRRARLGLLPAADASAEADLWLSSLVQTRSGSAMTLLPDVADLLRTQLAADLGRLDASRAVVLQVHGSASPLLALEEELVYWGVHPNEARALARIPERLLEVVAAMRQSNERARNLAAWAARALPRLPARVRDHDVARGLALAATKLVATPRSFERAAPSRATLKLVQPFVRPEGRIGVAVRRITDALELRRGSAEAGWHAVDVRAPPIVYVGGRGVAVPVDGVARAPAPGNEVDLRDTEGRGWRLEAQQDGQAVRPCLARIETSTGVGVAYLLAADVAVTSGSLVHENEALTLRFPAGMATARVAVMGPPRRGGAILRLDRPLSASEWLTLDTSSRPGMTWRVFPPEPKEEPAALIGTILEVSNNHVLLAAGPLERRDLLGAPVIVAGRVVGHVSGESTSSGIVARPAIVVESLLKRLSESGDRSRKSGRPRSGQQYLVVRFPEAREVMVDGVLGGQTNDVLQIQTGFHNVTLAPPVNFAPVSRTVPVENSSPLHPLVVEFHLSPSAEERMAIQQQININKNIQGSSPRVKFDPNPLSANTRDQIFWTNNDSEPHWPGLLNSDGSIDPTFFMPNQIAPNGDASSVFAPFAAETFDYACSLHPNEKGRIEVTALVGRGRASRASAGKRRRPAAKRSAPKR